MKPPVNRIENAEAITSLFGRWPSFHDSEVLEFRMLRDGSGSGRASLVARVHVFEMTDQVNSAGYYICQKHSIATLEFGDVDDLVIEGFNHQNALSSLDIQELEPGARLSVTFEGANGLDASLTCRTINVVAVALGIPDGSVYSRANA